MKIKYTIIGYSVSGTHKIFCMHNKLNYLKIYKLVFKHVFFFKSQSFLYLISANTVAYWFIRYVHFLQTVNNYFLYKKTEYTKTNNIFFIIHWK